MRLGCHISMSSPDYLLKSVQDMISYDADVCMIYTGPPQNGCRVSIDKLKIKEANEYLNQYSHSCFDIVVHAPYLINLANTLNPTTFANSVELLRNEIKRTDAIGSPYLVLHPGSHVNAGSTAGIKSIISGLKEAFFQEQKCIVCIETMAGKGSECGKTFEELRSILEGVDYQHIGVCLDTCHVHDAGYDLHNFESVLNEFDRIIGLDYLKVVHLNDSKNILGAHKDRHENIGHGEIGFDILCSIAHHPLLKDIPIILETPYINEFPPYKEEIQMLRSKHFINIK